MLLLAWNLKWSLCKEYGNSCWADCAPQFKKKTVIIDIKSVKPHSANNISEVGGDLFTDFHIRTLPRQLFKTGIHQR